MSFKQYVLIHFGHQLHGLLEDPRQQAMELTTLEGKLVSNSIHLILQPRSTWIPTTQV